MKSLNNHWAIQNIEFKKDTELKDILLSASFLTSFSIKEFQ
jgi:hypothetical protein